MILNNIDIWQFAVPFRQYKMNKANANGLTPRLMPSSSSNSSDPMSDMFEFWSFKTQKRMRENSGADKSSANMISICVCSGSLVCVA